MKFWMTAGLALAACSLVAADQSKPSYDVTLPGAPFGVVSSPDGQWVFVSITGGAQGSGISVLHKTDGVYKIERTVPLSDSPTGIVLTHRGDLLIAAAGAAVIFLDTQRLENGQGNAVVQRMDEKQPMGSVYVNVTADDKTLFVSQERREEITVVDLDKIRAHDANAITGNIPTGEAPIALTFSKDEKWLFTTSEVALPNWGWTPALKAEGGGAGDQKVPPGAVIMIDTAMARTNPAKSAVALFPAGGSPVRSVLSPDGKRLYVTARGSDALLVFDTADLIANRDQQKAVYAAPAPVQVKPISVPVGSSPVPVTVVADGKYVLVGNSDRFGNNPRSSLTVLDASLIGTAQNPILGQVACGGFPREFHLTDDGKTLLLTNFRSRTLQVIDVNRLMELVTKP